MTATDLGGGSVGTFMPTTVVAVAAAQSSIALPLGDAQAELDGAIAASATITVEPPSLDLTAALEAAASLPGVTVDITAMGQLGLQLEAQIQALNATLSLIAGITVPFGTAGVRAYALEGEIGSFGADLGGKLVGGIPGGSGPAQLGFGIVLVAADDGAIAALKALFAT